MCMPTEKVRFSSFLCCGHDDILYSFVALLELAAISNLG